MYASQELEKHWKTIRDEGMAQLNSKTGLFTPEEENLRETGDWKQLTLYQKGLILLVRPTYSAVEL